MMYGISIIWALLCAAAPLFYSRLGTSPLGFWMPLLIGLATTIFRCIRDWKNVKNHIFALFRDALIIAVFLYLCLYGLAVVKVTKDMFATAKPEVPVSPSVPRDECLLNPASCVPPHIRPFQTGPILSASIVHPGSPAIVVENASSTVAKDILWELVLYKSSDLSVISFPTRPIGFVKPQSKSAPYQILDSGVVRIPSGIGQIRDGDILTGTLIVDCSDCQKGDTYLVHFVWGKSGWFTEMKKYGGKLALPKANTREDIQNYIAGINLLIPARKKIPIL